MDGSDIDEAEIASRDPDATAVLPVVRGRRATRTTVVVVAMSVLALAGLVTLVVSLTTRGTSRDPDVALPGALSDPATTASPGSVAGHAPARPSASKASPTASRGCSGTGCGSSSAAASHPGSSAPSPTSPTASASNGAVPTAEPRVVEVTAKYGTLSSTSTAFRGRITVTNTGGGVEAWQVYLSFPAGVRVTGATTPFAPGGQRVAFTGLPLSGHQTVTVDFDATRDDSAPFEPTGCSVNGHACA